MSYPHAVSITDIQAALIDPCWDVLIIVAPRFEQLPALDGLSLGEYIHRHLSIDGRIGQEVVLLPCDPVPGKRLVLAPTGDLELDHADVRSFAEATAAGIKVAVAAGASCPLVWVENGPDDSIFYHAASVSYLGAAQQLWQPLEARETSQVELEPVKKIGIYSQSGIDAQWLNAVESGKRVARDLCGTEPERMAPPRFADYCMDIFDNSPVKISVLADIESLEKGYPMLMAVARASIKVQRHQPRVIRLVYEGQGPINKSLFLAGKAIVYDTGGADLKINGSMAGMSRDKGGGASVVGFMKTIAELQPKGLKVVAEIGVVRNSIGSDCFVPDEIITSHHGVRVRIGNTDAEGRLVLGDLLSHLRTQALESPDPQLFSVATLTGHAARALGPYSALVENGPSKRQQVSLKLAKNGDLWGDPSEISRSRREDYQFIQAKTAADDVISSNNAPSAITVRGHQFPMAFLSIASGIHEHGCHAAVCLPYLHIDIAGSGVEGGDWQHGKPTAATVTMLSATYLSK